jgi:hypothetical protein
MNSKLITIYSKIQRLCTCSPQLIDSNYSNCPDDHGNTCRYREAIPRAELVAKASLEENMAFYEALGEIIPRSFQLNLSRNTIEEICLLLEEVIENYVVPEHQDAGEIGDLRRLLDNYYQARGSGDLNKSLEIQGKLIDARNYWKVRHSELDHIGTPKGTGDYRMKKRN